MQSAVKSRPVYEPVAITAHAALQLFIAEGDVPDEMQGLMARCEHDQQRLLAGRDMRQLQQLFDLEIAALPLATTVYIAGSESYMWSVSELLKSVGMVDEQIHMLAPQDTARSVFCCHCYAVTEGVTHSPVVCADCQRLLAVTDHFSRKWGAYFGYQVNAEDASEQPDAEELS